MQKSMKMIPKITKLHESIDKYIIHQHIHKSIAVGDVGRRGSWPWTSGHGGGGRRGYRPWTLATAEASTDLGYALAGDGDDQ
jgi:hypothetical protein